jgi:ABC-type proline/glycine betaine transport system permease subunit|tara:strand:- start:1859 stop:2065 length:207 start_codon:yes stop_codon:yes gene_type:complete
MSLKAFHLVFIVLSILFSLVFGIWAIVHYGSSEKIAELILGIISLLGTVGMSVYLYFFLKKFKHVGYL